MDFQLALDKYVPVRYRMTWPVYEKYQWMSLRDFWDFASDKRLGKISYGDKETMELILGDLNPKTLHEIPVVFCDSSIIKKIRDPFADDNQDITKSVFNFCKEDTFDNRLKLAQQWIGKYGIPFHHRSLMRQSSWREEENKIWINLELNLYNLITLEEILYRSFNTHVVLFSHFDAAMKEFNLVYRLMTEHTQDFSSFQNDKYRDYVPFAFDMCSTEEGVLNRERAYQFLIKKSNYYLNHCRLSFNSENPVAFLLEIEPYELMSALWLKMNIDILRDGKLGFCRKCKNPFPVTRKDKVFCSTTCGICFRQRNYRAKRKLQT